MPPGPVAFMVPAFLFKRPNPKTAFLREPLYTKSRPLAAEELKARFQGDGKRAHHKACRFLAEPVPLLNYVTCSKCGVSLGEDDVFWRKAGS